MHNETFYDEWHRMKTNHMKNLKMWANFSA